MEGAEGPHSRADSLRPVAAPPQGCPHDRRLRRLRPSEVHARAPTPASEVWTGLLLDNAHAPPWSGPPTAASASTTHKIEP
jgi:hypothetical protein